MYKCIALAGIFLFFLFGTPFHLKAQYTIHNILVEGNVKTKQNIILRELPYSIGSTIAKDSLNGLNIIAQQQLFNTSLFHEAVVSTQYLDSTSVDIKIKVTERWYFFPLPYFRWVDRNFNQWWNAQNHSLERVNYGMTLRQANATGNNDKLTLGLITGYTQQSVLRYQFPYLDKKMRFGIGLGWQYFAQKEMNSDTRFDKQVFIKTVNNIQSGYRANINLLYRPNLFERHSLQIGFGNAQISDSGFMAQPKFLPNLKKSFSYVDASLAFSKVKFDYNAYPTKGSSYEFSVYQRFSGSQNLTSFQLRNILAKRISSSSFLFLEHNAQAKILSNDNFMDRRLLGYGTMQMSGLDYYVIDGNAGSIFKAALHYKLGTIQLPKTIGIGFVDKLNKRLPDIKYIFWLKAFTNLGYVYSERPANTSRLSNTLLRTAGIGVDMISIYDLVIKIDYSMNQLGDKGVYLRGGINF
jgi:outer membrane protein assembly factor BamA